MDSVMKRISRLQQKELATGLKEAGVKENTAFKCVIAPHDDYTYAGYMYPLALKGVKARTVILFGVAHRARILSLENQLLFDSYTYWSGPYGPVKVSAFREQIISSLPKEIYQVNDSMQKIEHSVEAEIPFLQYYNNNVEIISILVPYMNFERMQEIAKPLAASIASMMRKNNLKWGEDVALVISADAVHYGDEGWDGKNLAFYGSDSAGYKKAGEHEHEIMEKCMKGKLDTGKVKLFTEYTVKKENYKEYKWTWCGRYSVPLGMLTAYYLEGALKEKPLQGKLLGYSTSIGNKHVNVKDLGGMGTTAPANIRHWVGYPSIAFW
jgi:AmmeMemoRadiSam system protein B